MTQNFILPGTSLSLSQLQTNALSQSFTSQACDPANLTAMSLAGFAGRLAQFAGLTVSFRNLGLLSRFASKSLGLCVESGSFEMCHRLLTGESLSDGFLTAWRRNFFHFGILQFTGHLAQGQIFLTQQFLQSSCMLAADWGIYGIGLMDRPTGSMAEQWIHHLSTGLALTFGSHLSLIFSGGRLRTLEKSFSTLTPSSSFQSSSLPLQMAAHPSPHGKMLQSILLPKDFTNLSRDQSFLELLSIRRRMERDPSKIRRGTPSPPLTEMLNVLRQAGLQKLGNTSLDDFLLHSARVLDHLYDSWEQQGAHYIQLAKMGPHHTHTLSQLSYAKTHFPSPAGGAKSDANYGHFIRWAVFIANHRDFLELSEPFLLTNLSESTRLQCIEGATLASIASSMLHPQDYRLLIEDASTLPSHRDVVEAASRARPEFRNAILDASARDQMRAMEREDAPLEECTRDFVRLSRWAYWRHHQGKKYSTTSSRLIDLIQSGKIPRKNTRGLGTLEEFFDAWSEYVSPENPCLPELQDLYEATLSNLNQWHLRVPNRTPEAQTLIRAIRAAALRIYRGDIPDSFTDEKHPIHRSVEDGEIPLSNTGALSLVEIYEKYAALLMLAHYSRERANLLVTNALRSERRAQNLYEASPADTPPEIEALRIAFDEAILKRYRGAIPQKGEGALSTKNPIRDFHDRGIFPTQNRPGMPLQRTLQLMQDYALGSPPQERDLHVWQLKRNAAIDAAQKWKTQREILSGKAQYLHEVICRTWAEQYGGPPPSIGEGALPLAHPLRRFVSEGRLGNGSSASQKRRIREAFREAILLIIKPELHPGLNLIQLIEDSVEELDHL